MLEITPRSHFNNLTPEESEAIALLMEECGEVILACAKIKRHGFDSKNPFEVNGPDNRAHLIQEVIDVQTIIELLSKDDWLLALPAQTVKDLKALKRERLKRYVHHLDIETLSPDGGPKKLTKAVKAASAQKSAAVLADRPHEVAPPKERSRDQAP